MPTILITGAADGIGWATAQLFAANGYRVALADLRADAATARATELGPQHLAIPCDVAEEKSVIAMMQSVAETFTRLDAVVNNAGISSAHLPSTEQPMEEFDRVLRIHLNGTFCTSREAYKLMQPHGGGAIVNISSIAGLSGLPRRNAYGAAKAGIASMTRSMACEWASAGIRVNAIAPGYVATAMVEKLVADGFINGKQLERRIPLGRLAKPDEIAQAIFFLCSPAASYITGVTLNVDGGWMAYGAAGDASA